MRNIKLAFRTLFKTPFVTVIAVLSLALGIGANAAIFSLFDEMLRQPLPVSEPGRLVNLRAPGPQHGSNSCNQAGGCDEVLSYPMFRDLEKANTALSGLAAHRTFGVNIAMPGQTPINAEGAYVSGSYFPVLGIRPALGRLLNVNDDLAIGGSPVAVLGHAYWETQLGSDPSVINKQVTVNGAKLTVIGVAPAGFDGTTLGSKPTVYIPITMRGVLSPGSNDFVRRNSYWIYSFGRLKPGATIDQAAASLNSIYSPIINDVEAPLQKGMSEKTLKMFRAKKLMISEGSRGQSSIHKEAGTPIFMLFAITGIVLLIACANIANLLLARAANRQMEMAVRLSLGATRRQLIGQLLTESVLLAAIGGVISIYVAHMTLDGIVAMLKPEAQTAMTFSISTGAMFFAAALSLTTGVLFGLAPAVQSTRPDLVTELRNNSGKLSGGRGAARFRTALVTTQIALSMALLVSAGLFIKSLRNVSRVDLGIKIDNVVTFGISPGLSGYDTTRMAALYQRVEEEIAAIPGVTGVTASAVQILANNNWGENVSVEGFHKDPDTDANSRYSPVGPNYNTVMGVPLIAGRDFNANDNAGSAKVAIVNETFAKKFGLGRNAVGKHMSMDNDSLNVEIIGLAKDAKYSEVKDVIPPVFLRPYKQAGRLGGLTFYLRSQLPVDQSFRAIRDVMRRIDPNLPIEELKTMPQQV